MYMSYTGEIETNGKYVDYRVDELVWGKGADFVALEEVATVSTMCNDSVLDFKDFKNIFEMDGEATETALISLGENVSPCSVAKIVGRLESAKVVHGDIEGKWNRDYTLEFSRVLDHCTCAGVGAETALMTQNTREEIMARAMEYGAGRNTLKGLWLAIADSPQVPKDMDLDNSDKFVNYEVNLTFSRVVGMLNYPGVRVAPAIVLCKQAGVRVTMITGSLYSFIFVLPSVNYLVYPPQAVHS